MNIQEGISTLLTGNDLSQSDMQDIMRTIMTGQAGDAQIGGLLIALAAKGETRDEIVGAASVMRELANTVTCKKSPLTDIVGTGGDSQSLFNVSTGSAFIVAAAGVTVAKHGNRSITSSSGAADLLEAAGVRLDLSSTEVGRCIDEVGIGFMFALNHHSAMKHAIGPRKELKVRTIFNLLGPLTNPASAGHGLIGVYDKKWVNVYAQVFKDLGAKHIMCVSSNEGLDELSIAGDSAVCELNDGELRSYTLNPADVGLDTHPLDSLRVNTANESLALIKAAYSGEHEAAAAMLALNAGAAIYTADCCSSVQQGVSMAQDAMASGHALLKMQELAEFTQLLKAAS